MKKTGKEKPADKKKAAPVLEEPTSASGINHGQKVFANNEPSVTIEVEGFTNASKPVAENSSAGNRPHGNPTYSKASTPLSVSPSTSKAAPAYHPERRLAPRAVDPVLDTGKERKPFLSPFVFLLVALIGGYYLLQKSEAPKVAKNKGAQNAKVAGQTAAPPAQNTVDAFTPSNDSPSPITVLNKPPAAAIVDDDSATFLPKTDTENFVVIVNGKDIPVIGGKINLPLNQPLDIRFVRRGYKEIKLETKLTTQGTREIPLVFEKEASPSPSTGR